LGLILALMGRPKLLGVRAERRVWRVGYCGGFVILRRSKPREP
jgi:hypothetical protein